MKKNAIYLLLFTLFFALQACKKKVPEPTPPPTGPTRAELTKDSIFYYAKEIYLWSDALPTYDVFSPRKYTSETNDFLNYQKELLALTQFKINQATSLPYEYYTYTSGGKTIVDSKYSYITDITNKNPIAYSPEKQSAVDIDGNGNDFGIKLGAYDQGSGTFALFVLAVYPGSPADKAGIVRSHRIYKINGRSIGDNYTNDRDFINSAFNATTIDIEGVKYTNGTSGAAYTAHLTKAVYKSSPIYATKVFDVDSKKIGYLAYGRFSSLSASKAELDAAFENFNTKGVTDLIIDLRYNGGGYVSSAEHIINHIAPASATGQVMYAEHYNSLMQAGGARIMANQPFTDASGKIVYLPNGTMATYANVDYSIGGNTERFLKTSSFNSSNTITKVVFIVSGSTASASELVINCLKPFMDVKLVGVKTYGKPVGFFPVRLENKYDVYFALFQSKNSLGQGDYFDGIAPDINDDFDDPRNNFGDPAEHYISLAIQQIVPGVKIVTSAAVKTMSIQGREVPVSSLKPMKPVVDGNEFVGMIETKLKLKK